MNIFEEPVALFIASSYLIDQLMSASPALISPVSQQRQRLGGGESHLEVLPGGVLESHGQEVRPALGQGHSEDGGLSLLRFTSLL